MFKNIDKLLEIDEQIHLVFVDHFSTWQEWNQKKMLPISSPTILSFITRMNFIKNSIVDLYETGNVYSINILFRSLVEHFLKIQYLLMKIMENKNDQICEDYQKFSALAEDVDVGKAWKNVSNILQRNSSLDPFDLVKEIYPEFKEYNKKDIEEKIKQFRYKEIIKFLTTNINKEQDLDFILKLIPQYADLSSFVHGGVNADKIMVGLIDENKRGEELYNKVSLTISITASVQLFSFLLLYQYEESFGKAYNLTNELMRRFKEYR